MSAGITDKFYVKNLDCASCAAKIERGLKKAEGVEDVTVDFANLMLHVRTHDIQRMIEEVRLIEPNVELIPKSKLTPSSETTAPQSDFKLKREIGVLAAASILFGVQLVFEDWFHQNPVTGAE
jgi:Cd2+/Zn2+-exporting ATPase